MSMRTFTLFALLLLAHAATASAQAVKLEFLDGRVNLSTQNAPIRAILAEWTRLGGTRIVNGERVTGAPMTLELQGVPERQALDIILRGVAGYMIAAREVAGTGGSHFDRVMILPTSTAPRTVASTPTFSAPVPRQVVFDDDDDVDDIDAETEQAERQEVEALRRAQEIARQRALEQANRMTGQPVNADPTVGQPPTVRLATPFVPLPQPQVQQAPPSAPAVQVPGQVVRPSNPFTALPGSARPGEVTPAPPQDRQPPPGTEP